MLIKLLFTKFEPSKWLNSRKTTTLAFAAGLFFTYSGVKAQTSVTVPDLTVVSTFTGPFANSTRTYQMVIDDTQLTTLSGKYLSSISFKIPSTAASSWPASNITYPDYQIYLSDGVNPANAQLNFAANVVGTQTQVRSGSLSIPAGSVANNNTFSFDITFTTPYLYTGSNLVIEIRHTGSNGTSTSNQAVGTSATGYGSLFTSCWSSSTSVLQGNFSYVKISSAGTLGVKSVEINGGTSVYPNPVKDQLYVKSDNDIMELNIFNLVGQKVYSQKNSVKIPQINVYGLAKGNYILQTIDKNGNSASTKFIKE